MPQVSKRNDLIEHGLEIVHQHGFAASGVAAIAAAAGAPKGSFYNHFASKEDFGRTVIDRYLVSDRELLGRLGGEHARPGFERLCSYFEWLRQRARTRRYANGCLLGNLTGELGDSVGMRLQLQAAFGEWSTMLAELIEQGQRDGSIRSTARARVLADALIEAWEGALMRAKLDRRAGALDRFMDMTLPGAVGAGSQFQEAEGQTVRRALGLNRGDG